MDTIYHVYIKQIILSSSSVGANYIEANEKSGRQDMLMHIKISGKEAKKTQFWLLLLIAEKDVTRNILKQEGAFQIVA